MTKNNNFNDFDDFDDIDIPDIDFMDIDEIVHKGVKEKKSFSTYLRDIFREIGVKNIFHDKIELFFMSAIGITTVLFTLTMIFKNNNNDYVYSSIFMIAPMFYLVLSLFSFFNAKEKGAMEIELTCKYNLHQLSAIRMFIFSILAMIINTFSIGVISIFYEEINLFKVIATSVTALFLFSSMFLYVITIIKKRNVRYLVIASWIFINAIFTALDFKRYNNILEGIPMYIHLGITIVCLFIYIKSLKKYMNFRGEE